MATVEQRGAAWRACWRMGGRRGTRESTTWPSEDLAREAAAIASARHHNVTAAEVYRLILGGSDPAAPDLPTVAEWADLYLSSKTRISPGTRGRYRRQLDTVILPRLGHLRLDQVAGHHVSALLNELRSCDCAGPVRGPRCTRARGGHGLDDRTVTRYYAVVHALFEYAVREHKIPDNPAKRTDWVRDLIAHDDPDAEGADHVYLSHQEYALIRSHAAPDARTLLDYLVGTGARWGEATAAAVDSVDPMAKPALVRIHCAWKQDEDGGWYLGSTKGRSRRTVEIGSILLDALLPLVASEPGDALLFRTPAGSRVDYSNFRLRRWEPAVVAAMRCPAHPPAPRGRATVEADLAGPLCGGNGGRRTNGQPCGARVRAGMDRCRDHVSAARDAVSDCACPTRLRKRPTIHDLRHSCAAWLIAAGEPLTAISQRLGHHSVTITERVYAGILPQVRASMAAAIDDAMRSDNRRESVARR